MYNFYSQKQSSEFDEKWNFEKYGFLIWNNIKMHTC